MKKLITIIFAFIRLTSLAQSTADYTLIIKLDPSFLYSSKLIIHSARNSSYVQLELYKHYKDVTPISTNKAVLEMKELSQLTYFLNTYKFKDNISIDSIVTYKKTAMGDSIREARLNEGSDGIIVRGILDQNKTIRKFEFWSPDKGTANDKLAEILFSILYKAYSDEMLVNYFEQLEQYFPHGLGLKKMSDNPLKYKLYGYIYIEYKKQLDSFFDSLPHSKKVFIDMANFNGMDMWSESLIEEYVKKNKKIYWINPTDPTLVHLYDAGVRNSHIISKRKIVRIEEKDDQRKIVYKNY
jgi:hypothetical protein